MEPDVKIYVDPIKEPAVGIAAVSIAISLKRIADVMERSERPLMVLSGLTLRGGE